jgi:hypothetical protein
MRQFLLSVRSSQKKCLLIFQWWPDVEKEVWGNIECKLIPSQRQENSLTNWGNNNKDEKPYVKPSDINFQRYVFLRGEKKLLARSRKVHVSLSFIQPLSDPHISSSSSFCSCPLVVLVVLWWWCDAAFSSSWSFSRSLWQICQLSKREINHYGMY